MSHIRPDIAALDEYTPVEPIDAQAARLGLRPEDIVKLDGNENPYGPSPLVASAVAAARFDLYPDPFHTRLRAAVSPHCGAPPDRIVFGNGSDELLELIIRLVVSPGDEVITCEPTFGMYSFLPPLFLGKVVNVPRREDFSLDVAAVKEALSDRTKLIIVASPNNPTGNLDDTAALEGLGPLVVVDQAYVEFAARQPRSGAVVLRTFSKWAGLAGLRVGYGVFPEDVITHLWKIKQPYNVNVAAEAAVLATLEDCDRVMANVRKIVAERKRMREKLSTLKGWTVYPSEANFLLCRMPDAPATKDLLWRKGIMVRSYFGKERLDDCLRISVGMPEHTDRIMEALS